MQTKEEVREQCQFVAQGIADAVASDEDLGAKFEGVQMMRFKVEKDGGDVKVVGGELGGDDSGITISETGVTKMFAGEIVGCQFDPETSAALREFFETCYAS